ncbi:MAG: pyridoxamine 5'-phosphate oxidase family protein [Tetrasphaera sp.]
MLDHEPMTQLTEEQCWELLEKHEFGRLAFHLVGEVHITPINYTVDSERLVFRTAEGSKLLGVVMNDDVAFEIDDIDDEQATSVVLRGTAEVLEGSDRDAVDSLPLRPWVDTSKSIVVAIKPSEITGRRFELHRPWLQSRPEDDEQ